MGSMNEAGLPVTNTSFYSIITPSLVVKSIVLQVDKLGSDKHQSWDICRIISPPWGTVVGWWQIWAFGSECIGSNFDCSSSDCRTATPWANSLLDPTLRSSWSLGLRNDHELCWRQPTQKVGGYRSAGQYQVAFLIQGVSGLVLQLSCKETRAISGRWRRCPGVSEEQHLATPELHQHLLRHSFQGPLKRHPETLPSGKPTVWCPFQAFIVYIQLLLVPEAICQPIRGHF